MANNVFEQVNATAPYLTILAEKNDTFGQTTYKVLQGLYMLMVEKKIKPSSLHMEVNQRGNRMCIAIEAPKKGAGASLDLLYKRNKVMAKMVAQIKDLNAFLYKIFYFCEKYSVKKVYQTADRMKIVIEGEKIEETNV